MKPTTIAESMASLRARLDSIEQSVPVQESSSVLKEHMNTIQHEQLNEMPNFLSGLGKGLALNKNAVPKGAASKIVDPNYSYKGQAIPQGKHYADPSPEQIASFERGRKTGVGTGVALGAVGVAGLTHWYDKYNDETPDPINPKANPKIKALQDHLNRVYKTDLEINGIYDKPTKEAYETYMKNHTADAPPVTPETPVIEPKKQDVVKEPEKQPEKQPVDQKQTGEIDPKLLTPMPTTPVTPPVTPPVTLPNANTQTGSGAQPSSQMSPDDVQKLNSMFQQMQDTLQKLNQLENGQ
jgi:hypothetical protein